MRPMIFCQRCGNYDAASSPVCPKCGAGIIQAGHESIPAYVRPFGQNRYEGSESDLVMEPAGHIQRLIALLLDSFVEVSLGGGGAAIFIFMGGQAGVILGVTGVVLALAYEPVFIAVRGATPGKSATGLRVVNENGERVSLMQSVARWIFKLFFNAPLIPMLFPLITKGRQAVHDIAVSTYVIKA